MRYRTLLWAGVGILSIGALSVSAALASPISDKYAAMGGKNGTLGAATTQELTAPDGVGRYQHFSNGSIYWSPFTPAVAVQGLIRDRWAQLGWEKSYLGYPMTDEIDTYDKLGKQTKFQGGELVWRPLTNKVSEIKATDLLVDLPTMPGEVWKVIQANAYYPKDSHTGVFVYCYDLIKGDDQPSTKGVPFVASASAKLVWADDQYSGNDANYINVVIQKLGTARYASILHSITGSYDPKLGGKPQTYAWEDRKTVPSGTVLAKTGDVGAGLGAFHIHYCITTAPDRPQFGPFESVPFAFRNFAISKDKVNWATVAAGVPRRGDYVRRAFFVGGPATVNSQVDVASFGAVEGSVSLPAGKLAAVNGDMWISLESAWGEPVASAHLKMTALNLTGPWKYKFGKVINTAGLTLKVRYTDPNWPQVRVGYEGQTGLKAVIANTSQTLNVVLNQPATYTLKDQHPDG